MQELLGQRAGLRFHPRSMASPDAQRADHHVLRSSRPTGGRLSPAAPTQGPGVTVVTCWGLRGRGSRIGNRGQRIADWRITLADMIADNASSGAVDRATRRLSAGTAARRNHRRARRQCETAATGRGPRCRRSGERCRMAGQCDRQVRRRDRGRPVRDVRFIHDGVVRCRRRRASATVSGLGAVHVSFH